MTYFSFRVIYGGTKTYFYEHTYTCRFNCRLQKAGVDASFSGNHIDARITPRFGLNTINPESIFPGRTGVECGKLGKILNNLISQKSNQNGGLKDLISTAENLFNEYVQRGFSENTELVRTEYELKSGKIWKIKTAEKEQSYKQGKGIPLVPKIQKNVWPPKHGKHRIY